ncbi:M48 family metallopeptidase [Pseudomonadota bacterium]
MLIYILFDFVFGFSVRSITKNCKNYEKYEDYKFLGPIFEKTKKIFGVDKVNLLIEDSDSINAYAVASTGNRNIILTTGLIEHFLDYSEEAEEFRNAVSGVIGHEMSHLVNKDFLPGLLLKASERATIFVSELINFLFRIISKILTFIPGIGILLNNLIVRVYNLTHQVIMFFHKYIVINLYMFILKQISRSIEYRCDRESCYAFGNQGMKTALSFLGDNGYFTLFSTHPSTKNRIKKTDAIKTLKKRIRVSIINRLSNTLSILAIIYISIFAGIYAEIPKLLEMYGQNITQIQNFYNSMKYKVLYFINSNL